MRHKTLNFFHMLDCCNVYSILFVNIYLIFFCPMGTGPDGVRRSGRNRKKAKLLDGWYLLCETSQSLNYYVNYQFD